MTTRQWIWMAAALALLPGCTEEDSAEGCWHCTTAADCDDARMDTVDVCLPTGCCAGLPESCDDGDPCTRNDRRDATGRCAGTPDPCKPSSACVLETRCDGKGGCIPVQVAAKGTRCDDRDACTFSDECDGQGICAGVSYTCQRMATACTAATCDGIGNCTETHLPAATACDDGDAGTHMDACDGKGTCAGTAYTCTPGSLCNDWNVCTGNDACDAAGDCKGIPLARGSSCGSAQCASYACDGAGACGATPLAAGTACDDRSECTSGDACDGKGACKGKPLAAGTICDNGTVCSDNDACDGKGNCKGGTIHVGRDCAWEAGYDPQCWICHNCDPNGVCDKYYNVPDSTPCGLWNTLCDGGMCYSGICL